VTPVEERRHRRKVRIVSPSFPGCRSEHFTATRLFLLTKIRDILPAFVFCRGSLRTISTPSTMPRYPELGRVSLPNGWWSTIW
jgi:hypothetical protein